MVAEQAELIDRVAAEEARLVFAHFDTDAAWRLGSRLRSAATVREWSASSYLVGLRFPVVDAPYTLEQAPWMDVARYSGSGGGFPIVIDGVGCVGTIAVSGLRHDLDHALIVEVVGGFLREDISR